MFCDNDSKFVELNSYARTQEFVIDVVEKYSPWNIWQALNNKRRPLNEIKQNPKINKHSPPLIRT